MEHDTLRDAGRCGRRSARAPATAALATALVATIAMAAGCSAGGAAYGPGVVVGTCRGFTSSGLEVRDGALVARAAEAWLHVGGSLAQAVPVPPPIGTICLLNAHLTDGRHTVTLADATHLATYVEPVGQRGAGRVVGSGGLPDSSPAQLPAVSVGDGTWQLATGVTSASVWVGAPGLPSVRTPVPAGQDLVPVDSLVSAYARQHPTVVPHLVLLARTATTLYSATGGAPYAATTDSVYADSLATPTHDLGADQQGYERLLGSTSGVPLLAQAVAVTYNGPGEPQHVQRLLTVVGSVTSRAIGPVLAVGTEPVDGQHQGPALVDVVQLSRSGADLRPIGTVLSPSGGWIGSAWLDPVQPTDPDPLELLLVGRPATPKQPALTLVVIGTASVVIRKGPVALVDASDANGRAASGERPHVDVEGRTNDGFLVLPLANIG